MVELTGIGFNRQGFFFEIQGVCKNQSGRRIGCGVGFDNFTGNPTFNSTGALTELVPDPDIAGTGIVVAIVIQTFLVFLLATTTVVDESRLHKDYIGISTFSDASTLLALAYITNFILTGKCTMSTYHYYIALDSVLMACSTLVLTFTTSRYRYFKILANYLRYFFMLAIFALLGTLIGYQFLTHFNADFPEWNPPGTKDRNASSLVLPASCFFDPDLIKGENPYAPKRTDKLSEDQLQRIGLPVKNYAVPQMYIYIVLTVFVVVGTLLPYLCCFRTRHRETAATTMERKT
ncbi:hypothetical protein IFR05_012490 [Cadophora sp. M221]|nr:hypothetical protein IFR05_012490 [Cadophora sp. M221]